MDKKQQKRKDNDPLISILRPLSTWIARLLVKTNITPNQITALSFIIFTPLIFYLIIQGKYLYNFIALGLMFIDAILDLLDGTLARIKSLQSKLGYWLEGGLDRIFQLSLLSAAIINAVRSTGNTKWFLIGLVMLVGQSIANFIGSRYENDFGFDAHTGSKKFDFKFAQLKRISPLDSFLKNIIVPSNLIYIFLFTCRYFFVFGLLFNRLDLFLIIFALTINIRWLSMYLLYLYYLSGKKSKLYTVRFLKEIYAKK